MASNTCRCCPDSGVDASVDFNTAGSARNFLERIGILKAYRNPMPAMTTGASLVHEIPLSPPLPLPELLGFLDGEPAPDRGKTLSWPHPDFEAERE